MQLYAANYILVVSSYTSGRKLLFNLYFVMRYG